MRLLLLVGVLALWAGQCLAQSAGPENAKVFQMEAVVVAASAEPESAQRVPRHTTVLTRKDIEQSGARTLAELLAGLPGVQVRPLFGHDKHAVVDLRGMGDTAPSNVLVMVDGLELNAPDLLGADVSLIDLESVERIEVIRGPGGVVHGDGAVGGVVNVVTRAGAGASRFSLESWTGSWDAAGAAATGSAGGADGGGSLTARMSGTQGYRDNGGVRRADVNGRADFALTDDLSVTVFAAAHGDRYGLPGPVSAARAGDREERKKTDRPDDRGEASDLRLAATAEYFAGAGEWTLRSGLRVRDVSYVMGYTPLLSRAEQTDSIDQLTWDLRLQHGRDADLWGGGVRLSGGIDYRFTDYVRQERSKNNRENSQLHDVAGYGLARWELDQLAVRVGGRLNHRVGIFRTDSRKQFDAQYYWINGEERTERWTDSALELGAVWALYDEAALFADLATSFRTPNVDELALAAEDLKPQHGLHAEAGARGRLWEKVKYSLALYWSHTEDEIAYAENPETGEPQNLNYDEPARRWGAELSLAWRPCGFASLQADYSWTRARFTDSSVPVPLVAEHVVSLGVDVFPLESLTLSASGQWTGERPDGNDLEGGRYDALEPYATLDLQAQYVWRGLEVYARVNNVADALYSAVAYSESEYPMPGRNWSAGFRYEF